MSDSRTEATMKMALVWFQFGAGTMVWLFLALHPGRNGVGRWIAITFAGVSTLMAVLRAMDSRLLAENRRRPRSLNWPALLTSQR